MRISDLTVRRRLALLGLFTNVLLVVVVALAAYTANSLTQRLDDSLKQQQAIEAAGDTTRSAQLFFRAETQALQSLLLQGGDATARAEHAKAVEAAAAEVDSRLALLERQLPVLGLPADPATEARGLHHEAHRRYLAAIAAYGGEPGSAFAVQRELQGADQATTQRLEELNEAIRQYSEGAAMWANTLAQEERFESLRALGILAVLALVASFAVGYLNSRSIVPQLARVVDLVKQVSTGDLTAKIETGRKDELGQVIRSLHDMNTALLDVVSRVQRGAAAVRRSSAEIADSNGELSSRTEEQASNLEQTAASIEEMTATVDQNARHARRADELAREAAGFAQRGGKVVGDMVSVMEEVQGRSRRIGEIIGLIDSIAFQTNILALNAAVEAARAGESGRGFAVVASEVRMLAQRSAEAAKQIKDLIQGATRSIDSGAALAGDAGRAMDEITASVGSVSAIIGEIAAATKEQQTGISQINRAVTELDRVTQQNASMVQQSASSSEALRHMALELEHAVGFFRIHAEELAAVAAAEPRPAAPRVATVHRLPRAA